MEGLFPEDHGSPAIFAPGEADDTLQAPPPVASTSTSTATTTTTTTLDPALGTPSLISGDTLLALEHAQAQQALPSLSASTASVQMLGSTSTDTPPEASSSTSTSTPTTTTATANANTAQQQQPQKRGRGRPRKAPNAPTRTKYARITKEEMSDEDEDTLYYRPTSSNSRRSEASSSLGASTSGTAGGRGKGKERMAPSPNNDDHALQEDRKGKRPALLVPETRTKSGRMVHKPEVYVPTFEPSCESAFAAGAPGYRTLFVRPGNVPTG